MGKVMLVIAVKRKSLEKAINRSHLVPKQIQVSRGGKVFMQTVFVDPNKENKSPRHKKTQNESGSKGKGFIHPKNFTAAEWKKQFTDTKATADQAGVDYILNTFGESGKEIAQKAIETQNRVKNQTQTISNYRMSGEGQDAIYTPERQKLHNDIIQSFFSPDKLRTARPPKGEPPVFMMLGGRGGSGKSKLKGLVYDEDKYVVIDADAIKEKLPEYAGWNAGEVHEESSDISKKIMYIAKTLGLNVVLDGTMSNAKKAVKQMQEYKNIGYRTEAHYMFLPVQESTKRAIGRFKTEKGDYSGRFVPLDMLLGMTENENAFDEVKNQVDNWSFYSNHGVEKNAKPNLISKKL